MFFIGSGKKGKDKEDNLSIDADNDALILNNENSTNQETVSFPKLDQTEEVSNDQTISDTNSVDINNVTINNPVSNVVEDEPIITPINNDFSVQEPIKTESINSDVIVPQQSYIEENNNDYVTFDNSNSYSEIQPTGINSNNTPVNDNYQSNVVNETPVLNNEVNDNKVTFEPYVSPVPIEPVKVEPVVSNENVVNDVNLIQPSVPEPKDESIEEI